MFPMLMPFITTRSDLECAFSFLNMFISNLGKPHWTILKWLLRYVAKTLKRGLVFKNGSEKLEHKGYVDSYFAGHKDQRKSTTRASLL